MSLGTFMIHGKKSKYQHLQEFGKSWFQLSWISEKEVIADVVKIAKELELEVEIEEVTISATLWSNLNRWGVTSCK